MNSILLGNLIVAHLVKKFPEGSLSCTQEFATEPYPETLESSPHLHVLLKIPFKIPRLNFMCISDFSS